MKFFNYLKQNYHFLMTFLIILIVVGFSYTKHYIEVNQNIVIETDKFQKLQNYNLSKSEVNIYSKDGRTSIDVYLKAFLDKKTIANFSEDSNIKCSYQFSNNVWLIKKQDMNLCTKDEAIRDINNLIEIVNKKLKDKEDIEKSWEKK